MANYNNLKAGIDAVIKTNGRQEISGAALNTQLKNMISELGAGYQYMGIATPATNPGTPDANVFYLASEAGTYTNFGGIVINEGEVCALVWNGTWTKQVTGAATADQVSRLGQELEYIDTLFSKEISTFTKGSSYNYKDFSNTLFVVGKKYIVSFTPSANLSNTTLKVGTDWSGSAMVDTIAESIEMVADKTYYFEYSPSQNGLSVLQITGSANVASVDVVVFDSSNMKSLQDLTDDTPLASSDNFVKSGGIFSAINDEIFKDIYANDILIQTVNTTAGTAYKGITPLKSSVVYDFVIKANNDTTITLIQFGTDTTVGSMVDTLFSGTLNIKSGVYYQIRGYKPSEDGLSYMRILPASTSELSYEVSIYRNNGRIEDEVKDATNSIIVQNIKNSFILFDTRTKPNNTAYKSISEPKVNCTYDFLLVPSQDTTITKIQFGTDTLAGSMVDTLFEGSKFCKAGEETPFRGYSPSTPGLYYMRIVEASGYSTIVISIYTNENSIDGVALKDASVPIQKLSQGVTDILSQVDAITSYQNEELVDTINYVNDFSDRESVNLMLSFDLHYKRSGNTHISILNMFKLMEAASQRLPLNMTLMGGDYMTSFDSPYDINTGIRNIDDLNSGLSKVDSPKMAIIGNHERHYNGNGSDIGLSESQFYTYCIKKYILDGIKDDDYDVFHFDDEVGKIRHIFISTSWETYSDNVKTVFTSLLSSTPSGYSVVCYNHYGISGDDIYSGVKDMLDIVSSSGVDFIAWISGHTHKDCILAYQNMLVVGIGASGFDSANTVVNQDGNIYTKTANTKTETMFSIITINKQIGKLFLSRYGAGVNMEANYNANNGQVVGRVYKTLSGVVYASDGTTPIENASVTLSFAGGTFSTTTDSNGAYSFNNLPSEDGVLTTAATGYTFGEINVNTKNISQQNIVAQ